MTKKVSSPRWALILAPILVSLVLIGAFVQVPSTTVQASSSLNDASLPTAACAGGPTKDGILLDECYVENFNVGGDAVSITVWYTKNPVTATRVDNGTTYILEHWINSDAEAQQVAAWGREAWEQYYTIFNRHPYVNGCGNNINVHMEDGVGWSGVAYWANPADCEIGIDSPMVRNGGGQWTTYHEFQHYQQYSFDDGCYGFLRPNYLSGTAPGDAEFVEGYADLLSDAVDAVVDSTGYNNAVGNYNPTGSFYNKSYGNVFVKYLAEQIGSSFAATDPRYHMDAVREHYLECDHRDTLYVLDTLIPSLRPDLTENTLFLNFFAANWAKDWADAATQPNLVYADDDGNPYGNIALTQNVNISSGSPRSWANQSVDDWAGRYYQVTPQAGCGFVTVDVDGDPGEYLGINLMAADTVGTTSVSRAAWLGEDFSRTFAGAGTHDRIVAVVNGFSSGGTFDVDFECVTPVLNILEPRQIPRHVMVGDPASPIAFLARFEITESGNPVRGVDESAVSAEAEGDTVTIVPGTFQEVGEEYWAVMLPPTKPVGTTFVDLTVCLSGGTCDTETDALLYVDPGNTDIALVFDASGSMDEEDIIGEGKRYINAQKAGYVLADLLRIGDRILVTDFSAFDNPTGCGLPYGDGDCALDIRLRLARTDVVTGTIDAVHTAIGLISPREWTPIGAALQDAKNRLLASPTNDNPKHIILLSDGEENVNPLYADVQAELIASGVVINTVGLSGDAPEALLAQIAADTGGTYRFVPTTGGAIVEFTAAQQALFAELNLPDYFLESIQATTLPGPLGLDDVYDYLDTESQGATRLSHNNDLGVSMGTWKEHSVYVDKSSNILRLVVAAKQEDMDSTGCGDINRYVEVLPPGADPGKGWISINPISLRMPPPSDWDIRHSSYDDVVIIPNPDPGTWKIRVLYAEGYCAVQEVEPNAPAATYDFMVNGSVQSEIRLEGRFLPPIVDNQGIAGDNVPIIATLFDKNGAIPGATIVLGVVDGPAGTDIILLLDDGMHNDGAADDGIYGAYYPHTTVGGTYNVRIVAGLDDPANPGNMLVREWNGSFWIDGPENHDDDKDGMPDPWEKRCGLNTQEYDAEGDLDKDGLINIDEFNHGTSPCDPDTDDGGEQDGSEVTGGRNPLWPPDDKVPPLGYITVLPFNGMIRIQWTFPFSYTHLSLFVAGNPDDPGEETVIPGGSDVFTLTNLTNGVPLYLTLQGANGDAVTVPKGPIEVTPLADPDPPSGALLINNGALETAWKDVVLNISATDTPLPGIASPAGWGNPLSAKYNLVSGDLEMRISNNPTFAGAEWEPYAAEKIWKLGSSKSGVLKVFAQFRDGAGNLSYVIYDEIFFTGSEIFLPILSQ